MARKREKNPEPRKAITADYYWEVRYMDVEVHTSKMGKISIRVDYDVEEREWPISEYFVPDHKSEYPRRKWREFKAEMEKAGHSVGGKSYEAVVELSEGWLMPSRIGVAIEDDTDEEGTPRENIRVVDRDWSDPDPEEEGPIAEDNRETWEAENDAKAQTPTVKAEDEDDLPF